MKVRHIGVFMILFAALPAVTVEGQSPRIIYVTDSQTGNPDGESWATAWHTLQDAIDDAQADQLPPDEIWVRWGTYEADDGDDVDTSIILKSGVAIYGGFLGNETLRSQRDPDPHSNATVISGDLGGGAFTRTLFSGEQLASLTTVIDGFEIVYADETAIAIRDSSSPTFENLYCHDNGGADSTRSSCIWVEDDSTPIIRNCEFSENVSSAQGAIGARADTGVIDFSHLALLNCVFRDNVNSGFGGGAIYWDDMTDGVTIDSCTFEGNQANGKGGAVYVYTSAWAGAGSVNIRNSHFADNTGTYGAAVYIGYWDAEHTSRIISCTFDQNHAVMEGSDYGGRAAVHVAIYTSEEVGCEILNCSFTENDAGSGSALSATATVMRVANCLFAENTTTAGTYSLGGAVYLARGDTLFVNCSFVDNICTGATGSGGIETQGFSVGDDCDLYNCILWGNSTAGATDEHAQIDYEDDDVGVYYSCIMGLDYLSAFPGNTGEYPGWDGAGYTLSEVSPCVDAGINDVVLQDVFDLDGDGDTQEATPDLAMRNRSLGSSVRHYGTCQSRVDMGAYEFLPDCNGNEVPDLDEMDANPGLDINDDAILDECQDCNSNGIPDPCDIACGPINGPCDIVDCGGSSDVNLNCIPDECECEPADLTQDGTVDGEDIEDFIACFLGGDVQVSTCVCADMDGDADIDMTDVGCFVQKLLIGVNRCGCIGGGPRGDNDCNGNMIDDAYDIATQYSNDANSNGIPDECEDCNSNGVPDDLDISQETSTDVNSNGIPDDCEYDCDGNGLPDAWEISQSLADDCNTNGQLDVCESDCNSNGVPDDCDIDPTDPDGDNNVSPDCNGNEFPDECDLALPPPFGSLDCNENGIPDECDIASCEGDPACDDCNENGYPDECDIESSLSEDANENGIPDECEGELLMGGGSGPPLSGSSSSAVFDEEAAWAEFYEWSFAQEWGPDSELSGSEQFELMLDKLKELGLPTGRP